jgi:hypothetical protein
MPYLSRRVGMSPRLSIAPPIGSPRPSCVPGRRLAQALVLDLADAADSLSFCGHMAAVDCGPELAGYLGFHWHTFNCGRKIFDRDAVVFQKEHDHWPS